MKNKLENIINELVSLGEDKEELSAYLELFDALDETAQKELLENLSWELEELKKLER